MFPLERPFFLTREVHFLVCEQLCHTRVATTAFLEPFGRLFTVFATFFANPLGVGLKAARVPSLKPS